MKAINPKRLTVDANPYGVAEGQAWAEVDPRAKRVVDVVSVGNGYARIRTQGSNRIGSASLARFNGKRGGYRRVK